MSHHYCQYSSYVEISHSWLHSTYSRPFIRKQIGKPTNNVSAAKERVKYLCHRLVDQHAFMTFSKSGETCFADESLR
jgi:hypothetical protein